MGIHHEAIWSQKTAVPKGIGQESSAYTSSAELLHVVLTVSPIPIGKEFRTTTIQTNQHALHTPETPVDP